jgi:hypothetical protein
VKKLKVFNFAGSGIAHDVIHDMRRRRIKDKLVRTLTQREYDFVSL